MYNIEVNKYYPQNYKYDMSRFMRYDSTDQMYDILDSAFIRSIKYLRVQGIKTVTVEEGSTSIMCETIYGYFNYQYWWILMEMNNLTGPEDLIAGMQIVYPPLASLDRLFSALNPKNN